MCVSLGYTKSLPLSKGNQFFRILCKYISPANVVVEKNKTLTVKFTILRFLAIDLLIRALVQQIIQSFCYLSCFVLDTEDTVMRNRG